MSDFDPSVTLGEAFDKLSDADKKRIFNFLVGIVEFYGNPDTWFATMTIADPPAGPIMSDEGKDYEGKERLGRRARLAYQWVISTVFRKGGGYEGPAIPFEIPHI